MKFDGGRIALTTAFQTSSRRAFDLGDVTGRNLRLMANYQGPGAVRAAFRLAQGGPLTAYSAPEAAGPGTNFSTRNQDAASGILGEPAVRKRSITRDTRRCGGGSRGNLIGG